MDFSSVKMLASIFCETSFRQYSIRRPGLSRVSNCHCTRKGLVEYPDAPATQTISPLQSIRIKLTFCSLMGQSGSHSAQRCVHLGSLRFEDRSARGLEDHQSRDGRSPSPGARHRQAATALSHLPFLLLITYLTAGLGFNKFNGLGSR
jgi:hypothetical protein